MKILADTSVLVAALVEVHREQERAHAWLEKARREGHELFVAAHTLAEVYSGLTGIPVRPRISPAMARQLVRDSVEAVAKVVPLDSDDYRAVLDEIAELNLSGGVVYDALIVRAARKAGVDQIVTFDVADFRRVWPDGEPAIVEP